MTATDSPTMAKKPKAEPEPKKRERLTAPVQVTGDLAHMVGVVCAHDGVTQAELLSGFLRPYVEEHYRRRSQSRQTEQSASSPSIGQ